MLGGAATCTYSRKGVISRTLFAISLGGGGQKRIFTEWVNPGKPEVRGLPGLRPYGFSLRVKVSLLRLFPFFLHDTTVVKTRSLSMQTLHQRIRWPKASSPRERLMDPAWKPGWGLLDSPRQLLTMGHGNQVSWRWNKRSKFAGPA